MSYDFGVLSLSLFLAQASSSSPARPHMAIQLTTISHGTIMQQIPKTTGVDSTAAVNVAAASPNSVSTTAHAPQKRSTLKIQSSTDTERASTNPAIKLSCAFNCA